MADVSIEMNEEERSTIDAATRRDPASWAELSLSSSAFWHPDLRELRVYFPVRDALLTHGRSLVEANERGELAERALEGDYRVLGRRATDDVHGVPSNVIRDGLVLLSSPWGHAYKRADNVYVYDFGVRSAHDHHDAHLDARDKKGKVSCYKNHGNKICSFLPGCRQNRCAAPSRSSKSCVDYNGWPVSIPFYEFGAEARIKLTPSTRTARVRARRASSGATARSRWPRASAGTR